MNDAVNANYRQQQRDPCKSINGGPVEFRTGEDFIQPLLHGFHAEYRNLWIYRLDGVADSCEVIFRAAIDTRHECREEAAGISPTEQRPDSRLQLSDRSRTPFPLLLQQFPRSVSLNRELMIEGVLRRAKSSRESLIHDRNPGARADLGFCEFSAAENLRAHGLEVSRQTPGPSRNSV